jgi:hypothetical protein
MTEVDAPLSELAAVLTRAMAASQTTATNKEACQNFANGRCSRAAADCKYSHESASRDAMPSLSNRTKPLGERKKITCYNCQKVGYHMASECKAPKQERRRPRSEPSEQANHTGEGGGSGSSLDVATFMRNLQQAIGKGKGGVADEASDGEHACMMIEEVYPLRTDYDLTDAYFSCPAAGDDEELYGPPPPTGEYIGGVNQSTAPPTASLIITSSYATKLKSRPP